MMSNIQAQQRIVQLTPLDQALAALDSIVPVRPTEIATGAAFGRTLAADAVASPRPAQALALRDGWAVRSELTLDASCYTPAVLPELPAWLDVGEPLPVDADAVAPLETLLVRHQQAEAVGPSVSGDGVLLTGADVSGDRRLRRAGERLRATDIAVLMAAGIDQVSAHAPRIQLVRAGTSAPVIDAAVQLIARAVDSAGGSSEVEAAEAPELLEAILRAAAFDACIVIGGTGIGRHDASVATLRGIDRVEFHGVALTPGETFAFGWVGARPVLLLPGRLDAALAGWLMFGRPVLAKLCGGANQEGYRDDAALMLELARKVTSTIGMAEIIPVRRHGEVLEPLASGYLPLSSLVSDGWILLSPQSEGYPAGTRVVLRPWP